MSAASVRVHIHAPIGAVFAKVSDHEGFVRLPGTTTRVTRVGTPEPNGLGCLREVQAGRLRFVEEITAWDAPNAFEYRIVDSSLPLRHEGSRLTFRSQGAGTEVEWRGVVRLRIPLFGRLLDRVLKAELEKSFRAMLEQAKADLEQA